jgi:2-polyprenyl-6-hydroxyphenyl methylase/3-demethylubiquinone-9 3-methyltransferase
MDNLLMTTTETNIDPAELAKFGDLAHQWWDPLGPFRTLHEINPTRLAWIERYTGPLSQQRVLDVGCGGGLLAEAMARKGAQVLGIDMAERSLRVARLHALEAGLANVAYRQVAVEALAAEQPGLYDAVTCLEMLEHVPDPASVVRACAALTRPGGWVFFSTINRSAKAFALAIVAAEYVLDLVPRGTHEYARLLRPAELAEWVRQSGLELVSIDGLQYNPWTRRAKLSSDPSVNYLLAARRPTQAASRA